MKCFQQQRTPKALIPRLCRDRFNGRAALAPSGQNGRGISQCIGTVVIAEFSVSLFVTGSLGIFPKPRHKPSHDLRRLPQRPLIAFPNKDAFTYSPCLLEWLPEPLYSSITRTASGRHRLSFGRHSQSLPFWVKGSLLNDVRDFLDPASREQHRGSYRRCYPFHGPTGTGRVHEVWVGEEGCTYVIGE